MTDEEKKKEALARYLEAFRIQFEREANPIDLWRALDVALFTGTPIPPWIAGYLRDVAAYISRTVAQYESVNQTKAAPRGEGTGEKEDGEAGRLSKPDREKTLNGLLQAMGFVGDTPGAPDPFARKEKKDRDLMLAAAVDSFQRTGNLSRNAAAVDVALDYGVSESTVKKAAQRLLGSAKSGKS